MKSKLAAVLLTAAIVTVGCGGGSKGSTSTTTSTMRTPSSDTGKASSGGGASNGASGDVKVDTPVELGDGTTLTIANPHVVTEGSNVWIEVDMTFANNSKNPMPAVMTEIVCNGATRGAGFVEGSTYVPNAPVKPGEESQGTLKLLPSGNDRTGDPIVECQAPAYFNLGTTAPRIPVPDDVLSQYNAALPGANAQAENPGQGTSPSGGGN